MRKKYPALSFETVEILQVYVKKAEYYIYDLATQANSGKISDSDVGMKARRQYPWLSEANSSRLAGIGMYYANR